MDQPPHRPPGLHSATFERPLHHENPAPGTGEQGPTSTQPTNQPNLEKFPYKKALLPFPPIMLCGTLCDAKHALCQLLCLFLRLGGVGGRDFGARGFPKAQKGLLPRQRRTQQLAGPPCVYRDLCLHSPVVLLCPGCTYGLARQGQSGVGFLAHPWVICCFFFSRVHSRQLH